MNNLNVSIYSDEELLTEYVQLINDSVRKSYNFAENQDYYKNIGASFTRGKKYIKVLVCTGSGNSVHAFIDSDNNVYKAAGCNAPAKGIRYNLNTDMERLRILLSRDNAYTGSYLYK